MGDGLAPSTRIAKTKRREGVADFSLDLFDSCGQKVTQVEISSRP